MNNPSRLTNSPSPLVLSDWPKRPILSKDILKKQIILHPFDTFCFAIATQNTQDERARGSFREIRTIVLNKNHIVFKLLEVPTYSEVQTHTGRIDTIVEEKRYYAPYMNSGKHIELIGISFNYIERAAGTTEGPTFNIEWKSEEKKI